MEKTPPKAHKVIKELDNKPEKKNAVEQKIQISTISNIIENYLSNVNSVEHFYHSLIDQMAMHDETVFNDMGKIMRETAEDIKKIRTKKDGEVALNQDVAHAILKKLKKVMSIPKNQLYTLSASSFIMINNYFEYIFSDLLIYHRKKYPQANNYKVTLSISDLKNYENIDDIISDLIIKEVESLIFELNFEELINYFTKNFKIELNADIVDLDSIKEIRETRNLVIHNNAKVNYKYLQKTKNPYEYKIGDEIKIEKAYLTKTLMELKLAGILICFECWGEWEVATRTEAISRLLDIMYNHLLTQNYEFVEKLGLYAQKNIRPADETQEESMLNIIFNYCISLKKQGKQNELDIALKKIKTSTLTPKYKMAHMILSNQLDKAVKIFPKSVAIDDIIKDYYLEWPIFEDLRNDEQINLKCLSCFT
jgi:hypothetical protein